MGFVGPVVDNFQRRRLGEQDARLLGVGAGGLVGPGELEGEAAGVIGDCAIEVFFDHVGNARGAVADAIGEFGVVDLDKFGMSEVGVGCAQGPLGCEIPAQGVDAEAVGVRVHGVDIDEVTQAFGHLLAFTNVMRVGVKKAGKRTVESL